MNESLDTAGSKRNALRFHFKGNCPVSYKTAHQNGVGYLVDISTSGCFVRQPSLPMAVGDRFLLSFVVQNIEEPLEIQAICLRLDDNGFAAHFPGIDTGERTRLVKLFAGQARRSKNTLNQVTCK